jgi:hypothetical protein
MIARTRLDITLYAHCLSCYFEDRTITQIRQEEKLHGLLTFQQYSYHGR